MYVGADSLTTQYGAKQRRNWPERTAISPHKVWIPIRCSFIPGLLDWRATDRARKRRLKP